MRPRTVATHAPFAAISMRPSPAGPGLTRNTKSIQPDVAVGLAIPVIAGLVFLALRRARKAMRGPAEDE